MKNNNKPRDDSGETERTADVKERAGKMVRSRVQDRDTSEMEWRYCIHTKHIFRVCILWTRAKRLSNYLTLFVHIQLCVIQNTTRIREVRQPEERR